MKKTIKTLSILLVFAMLLGAVAACTPKATPAPEKPTDAVVDPVKPTDAPVEPTAEPTPPPSTRKGGWLDEIVISVIDNASVITQLKADAIDVYVNGMGSSDLKALQEAGLPYSVTNGTYYTIQFNPAVFTEGFNPFSNRKIREAFNYMIDRNYINQEYYAGGALPKWFAIMTNFGDYADLADVARALEAKYAYNLETAKAIIDEEIVAMGCTIEGGKYMRDGKALEVKFLIRNDGDQTRLGWGNYLADQMEKVGFTVIRQKGAGRELSPIWIQSDPKGGEWHMYTGGWGASVLNRDQSNIFQEMYLHSSQQGIPVFLENVSDEEFQKLGDDLYTKKYTTMEQRHDMMARALELSLQDSFQVMVIDSKRYVPFREGVVVTADLAAGVESAQIWPYTIRFAGKEGGTMRWTTQDFLFAGPWNPIAGSNTTSDQGAGRGTQSRSFMYDPYTGLVHPDRAESASLTVQTGLPVQKTLDWVTLDFSDKIVVPDDAIVDWDAEKQVFVTKAEKFPTEERTAQAKSVVVYPVDIFDRAIWHDGSHVDMADLVIGMIMTFDRSAEKSAIYDAQSVPTFEVFMETFKGFRITSENPLTYEYYFDGVASDAELNVAGIWTTYSYGEASFSTIAMMNKAEADGKLAYSDDKAGELNIEQTSLIGGPSLEILTTALDELIAAKTIPYEPTLGKYITADQAVARYEALKAYFTKYGNYWQGTGPYFLKSVDMNGKSLVLAYFDQYSELAERWSNYSEPHIADVEVEGPAQVTIGTEVVFDVYASFMGQPYPKDDIKQVKFLVFDATNKAIVVADAEYAEDGHYVIKLTADQTKAFAEGAMKLEVAVVPFVVAQPTFYAVEFTVAK